jgi:hypothetical protein
MKILVFQAAVSAAAIVAMTNVADQLRAEGHHVGLRSLPHFRNEDEPAEKVIVALTEGQARQYVNEGTALVAIFGADKIVPVALPDKDEELAELDWSDLAGELNGTHAAGMSLDELKAQAVLRGLEVRADSTAWELAHLLDIDQPVGGQEADRRFDRQSSEEGGMNAAKIGMRTSNVMPTVNGLDLLRMNDEQLRAAAASLGLTVPASAKRSTIINKITKTFAEKVGPPTPDKVDEDEDEASFDDGLAGLDEEGLRKVAETESIDLGRSTSVEGITAKIVEARKAAAAEEV